jgi:hypothetical protein
VQDAREDVRIQRLREGGDVEREQHLAAHRVDVAQGVGGGDGAEGVRIVDDRRKEIQRLDDRDVVREAIDSSVVRSL